MPPPSRTQLRRTAAGVVAAVGLYQFAVPLVVRGVFGARQRFAPASALPAPWWWITCAALTIVTAVVVVVLAPPDTPAEDAPPDDPANEAPPVDAADQGWEALSGVVLLVGLYNGVAPFVVRLVFGGDRLLLAFPLYLPAPWWWMVAGAVVVAAVAALAIIDQQRERDDT